MADGPPTTKQIPLARPVVGVEEAAAVLAVLRSRALSRGSELKRFEERFASFLGVAHASAVSSGTAGLHLAIRAQGIKAGDEVITSPFSFAATANALIYEGAIPVFADIDPRTWNMSPDAAAAARTERTAAVLPVHICGYPADVPAFESWGLPIVEDACQALGAHHRDGKAVGARGHPAVFGFYPNKQLTTGEGGMVTSGDSDLIERINTERNQGRMEDVEEFDHQGLGFNYRLSDVACALGVAQLERLGDMLEARCQVAGWYRELLRDVEGLELPCEDAGGDRRGWFAFVVLLPEGVAPQAVASELTDQGVTSKPYLPPIPQLEYFPALYRSCFKRELGSFPVCEQVAGRALMLPFFPELTQSQVERVADTLRTVLAHPARLAAK